MRAAERVILNTGFLYTKMIITLFISLYSTRLILFALGVDDFGIFNLVGGVIAMLAFLNGAMSVSTQRFLSFHIGSGDEEKLKSVFQSSIVLHLIIGIVVVILLEIGGVFFIENVLNIPSDRLETAKLVFHFMVVSTFFTINAVPYDAAINAHENMFFDALTGILESVVKLAIAISLLHTQMDKLFLYGLLMASLTIAIRIVKSIYCSRKYKECRVSYPFKLEKNLFFEMFAFAGWNMFGAFCNVIRNQGIAIVLNIYFGVVVNAAYGVANQVNGQLISFSTNMIKALNPQIAKSEGSGDRDRMLRLAMMACKISFILLAFFAIPLIIEMKFVLNLWLKEVPEYSIIFCQLILMISLVQQLTIGIMRAVQSVGKIKSYQIVIGIILILNLPLAFLLIKIGLPAYSVLLGVIFLEIVAGAARVWYAKRLTGLDVSYFMKKVVLNSVLVVVMVAGVAILTKYLFPEGFLRLIVTTGVSTLTLLLFSRYIVLTKEERFKIKQLFISFLGKLKNNKN